MPLTRFAHSSAGYLIGTHNRVFGSDPVRRMRKEWALNNQSGGNQQASDIAEPSEAEKKAFEEKKANPQDPNAGEGLSTDEKHASVLSSDPAGQWESKIAGKIADKFSGGKDESSERSEKESSS